MRCASALTLAFALIAASGCVSKRTADSQAGSGFRVGWTSRQEVLEKWGNPDSLHDGVWSWNDWETVGAKFKLGYWGIGVTVANARMYEIETRITFDEKGMIKTLERVETVPGGTSWDPSPW